MKPLPVWAELGGACSVVCEEDGGAPEVDEPGVSDGLLLFD
jgi:hypothetical protein